MDNNFRLHMHHKFAIIDKIVLLTGSFNWTAQAVNGNQENLIGFSFLS
jgi:cardiolipin hydrolase